MPSSVKQTLQLRHQLTCSGATIQSATYDSARHHVLSYDSQPLAPHTLRLFSLRREIKSVRLFDELNPPAKSAAAPPLLGKSKRKRGSAPLAPDAASVPVVHDLTLAYSASLDVYICVYTAQSVPLARAQSSRALDPALAVYTVLFLEPATLKKLVQYPGPVRHRLRCVCFESASNRLVLAIERKPSIAESDRASGLNRQQQQQQSHPPQADERRAAETDEYSDDDDTDIQSDDPRIAKVNAPMNCHLSVLQLSKRTFHVTTRPATSQAGDDDAPAIADDNEQPNEPQERTMLCIEKLGPPLLHAEAIDVVCAARHLTRVFGVGASSRSIGLTAPTENVLLEWRESSEKRLELIRRVMLRDPVSALALSLESTWLFTGHVGGAVRVWDVSCGPAESETATKRMKVHALGSAPLEADVLSWHSSAVTTLQIMNRPSANPLTDSNTSAPATDTDIMLVSADRDSGVVKHWQLQVRHASDDAHVQQGKIDAHLALVGSFSCDADPSSTNRSGAARRNASLAASAATRKKTLLESARATVPVSVTIEMGGFTETLLLVLHGDVINVLKVQTVMRVLQSFAAGDEVSALRLLTLDTSRSKLVVISGSSCSTLRIIECSTTFESDRPPCVVDRSLLPPASQRIASVSAIESFVLDGKQAFVLVGWSTGSVDVHALDDMSSSPVATLQDPRLNAWITAVGVVTRASLHDASSSQPNASTCDPSQSCIATFVFAGTENGQIFGWRAPTAKNDSTVVHAASKFVLKARACAAGAHAAHVVQLSVLESAVGHPDRLLSLGADGMVKVWDVLSLTMLGYVNTAAERHVSVPSCLQSIHSELNARELFLTVGFDDGMLGVWHIDERTLSFAELPMPSHHDRRVTSITAVQQPSERRFDTTTAAAANFVSCSLDMTVIVWSITDASIAERRFFDVGAPVVAMCVVANRVVVALANEVCEFEYTARARSGRIEVLERRRLDKESTPIGQALTLATDNSELSLQLAIRPDTPTTHSDGGSDASETSPSETAAFMVSKLGSSSRSLSLTTFLPTPVLGSTITVPSALTKPSTALSAKPDRAICRPTGPTQPSTLTASQTTKPHTRAIADVTGDEVCELLQAYIDRHSTSGTIAAASLSHFLATQRLVLVKHADFAIRRYLQEQRIDVKTQLSALDACEILLAIQRVSASNRPRQKLDAATRASSAERRALQEKARARKQREQRNASRKAVISFNILGEKTIRWEAIESVAATSAFDTSTHDVESIECVANATDTAASLPRSASPSILMPIDQVASPLREQPQHDVNEANSGATAVESTVSVLDNTDTVESGGEQQQLQRTHSQKNRNRSVAQIVHSTPSTEVLDHDLVERLTLSRCFEPLWSSGYCWCSQSPRLQVIWSGATVEKMRARCDRCHKTTHVLAVAKRKHKPHFSLRAILSVIADVYDELLAPSHALLFKSANASSRPTSVDSGVSIHAALHRVFTTRFGMQSVVEVKIKLFMLSATQYLGKVDAIAVFTELLGMFATGSSDEQMPDEMVALCVCCYSWFFSRAMVVNGDVNASHRGAASHADTPLEIESGRRMHWQFVKVQNALLCAQEMLMYPLVSPGYLRNIVTYTSAYAQSAPTRPQLASEADSDTNSIGSSRHGDRWIEVHRFLRLLVGEWRQQNSEFRIAERTLFASSLVEAAAPSGAQADTRTEVLEKLRLILSCFIFYDHSREGVTTVEDFTTILWKLRYLWPNESVTADEAALEATGQLSLTFENAVRAAKHRFGDFDGDGQICYLDFWAMLYIVGVRTLTLLKFRDIPSFCRDYKLEIAPDLHVLLECYMAHSSTMLLPRGFQLGKSSIDQRANKQHQRRIGGLHDGVFRMPDGLGKSLSLQELVRICDGANPRAVDPKDQIYVDGAAPALGQSASVSAMDRFRPVTREPAGDGAWHATFGKGPVVVGVRSIGVHEKQRAFLSVSAFDNDALPGASAPPVHVESAHRVSTRHQPQVSVASSTEELNVASTEFSNISVQFPFVAPQRKRVEMASKSNTTSKRCLVGRVSPATATDDASDGVYDWYKQILREHECEEQESQSTASDQRDASNYASTHVSQMPSGVVRGRRRSKTVKPVDREVVQASPQTFAAAAPVKKYKPKAVVVVPTIDKDVVKPTAAAPVDVDASPTLAVKTDTSIAVLDANAHAMVERTNDIASNAPSTVQDLTLVNVVTPVSYSIERVNDADGPSTTAAVDVPVSSDLVVTSDVINSASSNALLPLALSTLVMAPPLEQSDGSAVEESHIPAVAVLDVGNDDNDDDDASASDNDDERRDNSEDDEDPDGDSVSLPSDSVDTDVVHDEALQSARLDTDDLLDAYVMIDPSESLDERPPSPQPVVPSIDDLRRSSVLTAAHAPTGPSVEATVSSSVASIDLAEPLPSPIEVPAVEVLAAATLKPAVSQATSAPETLVIQDNSSEASTSGPAQAVHHTFRFSQQPTFRSTVPVLSNPFRSSQWQPDDDSDSDDEQRKRKHTNDGSIDNHYGNEHDNGSVSERVDDVQLQLAPDALAAFRASFDPRFQRDGVIGIGRPSLRHYGATHQLSRMPSRVDVNASLTRPRSRSQVAANKEDACVVYDSGNAPPTAEQGGGVVLSIEDEEQTQQKWLAFFHDAEAAMFSPLKHELRESEDAQRIHEEHQHRLMKKRQDQQLQDSLRLQQSRRESTVLSAADVSSDDADDASTVDAANFRLRRIMRESCHAIQHELQFGMSVDRELVHVGDAQYFFLEYTPRTHGSILTLRLATSSGEAEVFMSTETKVPCVSDFMWHSVSKSKTEGLDEGDVQKLVLYTHDLAKVIASVRASRESLPADDDNDAVVIRFYLSVVAVEPSTSFSLVVMASGQKVEPSRAIKMVDSLIGQFNELSKSFDSHAPPSRGSAPVHVSVPHVSSSKLCDRAVAHRSSTQIDGDNDVAVVVNRSRGYHDRRQARGTTEECTSDSDTEPVHYDAVVEEVERDTVNNSEDDEGNESRSDDADDDVSDDDSVGDRESFQHLLESISEKRGFGAPRSKSFFLTGPTDDQYEFIQDEVANLQDAEITFSPERHRSTSPWRPSDMDSIEAGKRDAIAAVVDRRLSLRSTQMLKSVRTRTGRHFKPQLSPLLHRAASGAPTAKASASSAATTLRVAQFAPRPIAYSISALDRSVHPHHSLSSVKPSAATLLQPTLHSATVLPQVRSATTLR